MIYHFAPESSLDFLKLLAPERSMQLCGHFYKWFDVWLRLQIKHSLSERKFNPHLRSWWLPLLLCHSGQNLLDLRCSNNLTRLIPKEVLQTGSHSCWWCPVQYHRWPQKCGSPSPLSVGAASLFPNLFVLVLICLKVLHHLWAKAKDNHFQHFQSNININKE